MHRRLKAAAAAAAALTLLAGAPAYAKGGTGGGGGGGGGGGTGGGGGGATTTTVGRIQRTSAVATCDGGSGFTITIDRGRDERAEVVMVSSSTPLPDGTTSLGGWWNHSYVEPDTGFRLLAFGGTVAPSTPSSITTILARTVTPGVHTIAYTGTKRVNTDNKLLSSGTDPVTETCTATITLVAV